VFYSLTTHLQPEVISRAKHFGKLRKMDYNIATMWRQCVTSPDL